MSDIYARAKLKRDEMAAELRDIESFLRMYERLSKEEPAATPRVALVPAETDSVRRPLLVRRTSLQPSKRELIEKTAANILSNESPLSTTELLAKFKQLDVSVGGTDEAVNLASYLSRCELFLNSRKGGGWSLKSQSAVETEEGATSENDADDEI